RIALRDRETKTIVIAQRAGERRQAIGDGGAALRKIGGRDRCQRRRAPVVLRRETTVHLAAHAGRDHDQRCHGDDAQGDHEARAKRHGPPRDESVAARSNASSGRPVRLRRAIKRARVWMSGTISIGERAAVAASARQARMGGPATASTAAAAWPASSTRSTSPGSTLAARSESPRAASDGANAASGIPGSAPNATNLAAIERDTSSPRANTMRGGRLTATGDPAFDGPAPTHMPESPDDSADAALASTRTAPVASSARSVSTRGDTSIAVSPNARVGTSNTYVRSHASGIDARSERVAAYDTASGSLVSSTSTPASIASRASRARTRCTTSEGPLPDSDVTSRTVSPARAQIR